MTVIFPPAMLGVMKTEGNAHVELCIMDSLATLRS